MSMLPTMMAGRDGSSSQSRLSAKPPRRVEMGSPRVPSVRRSLSANASGRFRRSCRREPRRLIDHGAPVDDVDEPAWQVGAFREGHQPQRHHGGLAEPGGDVHGLGQVGVEQPSQ